MSDFDCFVAYLMSVTIENGLYCNVLAYYVAIVAVCITTSIYQSHHQYED